MIGLIEDEWDKFHDSLVQLADNLRMGFDTPNDKLILLFIANFCGIVSIDRETFNYIADMMAKLATTGYIEGNVQTALDDPEFVKEMF